MSSGKQTNRMLEMYNVVPKPTMALSSKFKLRQGNVHNSETVEVDVMRNDEEVAVVVQSLSTGPNENENTLYTNKEFKPPIYDERVGLNSFDLIKRQPGQDPFVDPSFRASAVKQMFTQARKLENKIVRAVELQAAQVLQTGKLALKDKAGVDRYLLDFQPKATHFPVVATPWANAGSTPFDDIDALADVIRIDGLVDVDEVYLGSDAFKNFINSDQVKESADIRRINLGGMAPQAKRNDGSKFQGRWSYNDYEYDIYTYAGRYTDPQTNLSTKYLDKDSFLLLSSTSSRFDLTVGSIPRIVAPDPRVSSFMPSRVGSMDRGMMMDVFPWVTENGRSVFVDIGARPLTIPVGIDTFGCGNSGV